MQRERWQTMSYPSSRRRSGWKCMSRVVRDSTVDIEIGLILRDSRLELHVLEHQRSPASYVVVAIIAPRYLRSCRS